MAEATALVSTASSAINARAEGLSSSTPFGTFKSADNGLIAALITSLPQINALASRTISTLIPALLNTSHNSAERGVFSNEVRPSPPMRAKPGPNKVAPLVVTPKTTRSCPRYSARICRFPRPFCKVTTTPFTGRQRANCSAARLVCQALTRINARSVSRHSKGSSVARTRY